MLALIVVLIFSLMLITIKCISYWIGILVTIQWMQENNMPQPNNRKRAELTKYVVLNLFKKSRFY